VTTIKDVAARAGVSFTTVSHVLNSTRRVSDQSRQRVERAVVELGYVPSALARALKTSETHVLGVLVPNITNPFFAELTRGVEDAARHAGYSVFLCNCDDEPARQLDYVQSLLARRVDGLLLANSAAEASTVAGTLRQTPVPTVVVERAAAGLGADRVRLDNVGGARRAAQHLLDLGHRRIACLAGPLTFEVSRARVAGWREAMAAAGIAPAPGWLIEGPYSPAQGCAATRQLLADHPEITAICAGNDLLGIGALRAAAERGVAVPAQLSVIGFDGIELGGYVHPGLTTVGQDIRSIGERAAAVLIERIRHGTPSHPGLVRELVVTPELILRESTGPVPA
jgi:LacI family transcriptional regulator